MLSPVERERRSRFFILAGAVCGAIYAAVNVTMDDVARSGVPFFAFPAFHFVVDRIVPIGAGLLLGTAVHYLRLRSALARAAADDATRLRERLNHTERDQAVWVVAAATLHEVKNPLHAMGLLLEELESLPNSTDASQRLLVEKLRHQWRRVLAPLDTLKAMTRQEQSEEYDLSNGESSDDFATIDVVVQRAIHTFSASDATVGKTLHALPVRSRRLVPASALRIALENLVANALEESTHVDIAVDEEGDQLQISVRDNGNGVLDESRLFRPSGSTKRSGLGLGLPIARALTRTLGGDVTYLPPRKDATPPVRTTFQITLPIPKATKASNRSL